MFIKNSVLDITIFHYPNVFCSQLSVYIYNTKAISLEEAKDILKITYSIFIPFFNGSQYSKPKQEKLYRTTFTEESLQLNS